MKKGTSEESMYGFDLYEDAAAIKTIALRIFGAVGILILCALIHGAMEIALRAAI